MQVALDAPIEVWELIASYVPTNPLVYFRLARVSRFFHVLFTSDKLWRFLTPFDDIRSNFYYQFILRRQLLDAAAQEHLKKLWLTCEHPSLVTDDLIVETDNVELLLPMMQIIPSNPFYNGPRHRFTMNWRDAWKDAPRDRSFVLCAVNSCGFTICLFPQYQSDLEIILTALKSCVPALHHLYKLQGRLPRPIMLSHLQVDEF